MLKHKIDYFIHIAKKKLNVTIKQNELNMSEIQYHVCNRDLIID